jgi:hypothetical protein
MNKGMNIVELAAQIQKIENGKKDLVVPSTRMAMKDGKTLMIGDNGNSGEYNVSQLAHEQIGARLKIPRDYYKRMQEEAPALLDQNVNNWLHRVPERRLVRTVDGNVRAILSDRYKRKENITVLTEALPFMLNPENKLDVMSSNLSEKQMFVKVVSDLLVGEVRVGQVVKGGFSLRNSEVGCGAFDLSLFVLTLSCMNGMMREHSMKEYHVGKRIEVNDNEESSSPIYSAETIAADEHAFKLKVRDTLKHALNRRKFDEELAKFRAAAENPLNPRMITDTIEDVTKRYSMTQNEGKDVLSRLLESKDFTQWGLSSAVTNLAGDIEDYDRSTELEKIGGQIIDLRPADWRIITRLAA